MDSTTLLFLLGIIFANEVHSSSIGVYHGPTVNPTVLNSGFLTDTHDGSYSAHGDIRYHGPTAIPHVLHDGHIADTHEVAAAKAKHLAAVSKATTHSGYGLTHNHEGGDNRGHGQESNGDIRYHGPTAIPHVLHDGHIADTHEVAAAKAKHLAAVSKATAHSGHDQTHHERGDNHSHGHGQDSHGADRYHGPTAIPQVLHDGHIADTHEVAAAKAEHLAAVSKATSHSGYGVTHTHEGGDNHGRGQHSDGAHGDIRYHGPTAIPQVLHDGHIADTHEVAAAKAKHLAAVSKATSLSGYGLTHHEEGDNHDHRQESHGAHADLRYHGPTAIPHVFHDGHIADTHAVTATKQAHHAAISNAKTHGSIAGSYTGEYGVQSGVHSDNVNGHNTHPYQGPLAKPVVLKSGYLADTPEVSVAKELHLTALQSRGHEPHYKHI